MPAGAKLGRQAGLVRLLQETEDLERMLRRPAPDPTLLATGENASALVNNSWLIGREVKTLLEAGRPARPTSPGGVLGPPIENGRDAALPGALFAGDL